MLQGKLAKDIIVGIQGVCTGHSELLNKGVLLSKCLVTCMPDHCVTLKILNPGNNEIHLSKGMILAHVRIVERYVL